MFGKEHAVVVCMTQCSCYSRMKTCFNKEAHITCAQRSSHVNALLLYDFLLTSYRDTQKGEYMEIMDITGSVSRVHYKLMKRITQNNKRHALTSSCVVQKR